MHTPSSACVCDALPPHALFVWVGEPGYSSRDGNRRLGFGPGHLAKVTEPETLPDNGSSETVVKSGLPVFGLRGFYRLTC